MSSGKWDSESIFKNFLMRQKSLKNHQFRRCWEHLFYIFIIPKKKHYEFSVKNWFNTKVGNVTFFSQNWFIGLSEYIWNFSAFFFNFQKSRLSRNITVTFADRSHRLPINFLSIVRNLFPIIHSSFVINRCFFWNKKKLRNTFKNSYAFTQIIDKSILATKI